MPRYSRAHFTRMKSNATGNGDAGKPKMIAAAKERFGLELDENAADALWAAAYALQVWWTRFRSGQTPLIYFSLGFSCASRV